MSQASGLAVTLLASSLSLMLAASADAEPSASPMQVEVPFTCGAEVVISQSHGTFSHVGIDKYAWDFRVPVGTPVLAAADGVVRLARSDSTRGGCDRSFGPDSNYVVISHAGGLETQYLHFSKVFVHVGQRVKAGTVIGEVGRTGFSCGAHLHFAVQRGSEGDGWALQSVPAVFREYGDPEANAKLVSGNCSLARPEEPLTAEAEPQADGV